MRSFTGSFLLLVLSAAAAAASEWSFEGGKAFVIAKGGAEGKSKEFSPQHPVSGPLSLSPQESLKLSMIVKEGDVAARPHQAFLLVRDPESGLETFYPMSVKESSGKARVELTHKDIPSHLLSSPGLEMSILLGSFGSSSGGDIPIGTLVPSLDTAGKAALVRQQQKDLGEGSVVYKAKPEIYHIFRGEPTNPPKTITMAFTISVLASLLGVFGVWFPILGGNFSHLPKALKAAPISHPLFFASLVALEGIFFLYYTSWNLFQTLGGLGVVGPIAFLSGSRALREVRARRERGER